MTQREAGTGDSGSERIPDAVLAFPEDSRAVELWARLRRWGMYMAARYNGPVTLVGSALKVGTPRDVDLRVEIADDEFTARYGYTHYSDFGGGKDQRWVDDMAKRCGELSRDFKINADFQVYAASNCIQYREQPRLVIASPSNLAHLAASTAWWDAVPTEDATEATDPLAPVLIPEKPAVADPSLVVSVLSGNTP